MKKNFLIINFIIIYLFFFLKKKRAQTSLPYHIEKVESNDQLFTEDPEFNTELTEFYNSLIKEILYDLNLLKDEPDNLVSYFILFFFFIFYLFMLFNINIY